jgi:hypothetical protein
MEDNEKLPWTQAEINEFKYDSVNHIEWETVKNDEKVWSKEEMNDFNK